jgi:predicted ArsR family transcriptional regulator
VTSLPHDLDTLTDITGTLGDSTRRGIYLHVLGAEQAVTASELARTFDIHPNVARYHLDRLVGEGYLAVTRQRRSKRSGPGAGRPAKCYQATDKEIHLQFPMRRFDLLASLLIEVVERLAPQQGAVVAEQVGREYGRALAEQRGITSQRGLRVAAREVAAALTGLGFQTEVASRGHQLHSHHCPFGPKAEEHPEVSCSVHKGIVRGLFDAARGDADAVTVPHLRPEDACVTSF